MRFCRLFPFLLTAVFISPASASGQKACNCDMLLDPLSKHRLILRDSLGRKIASVGNDSKNEDYLLLHLNAEKDSMFHVDVRLSIGDTQLVQGWVRKQRALVIHLRNYQTPVFLYSKPGVKTKTQGRIYYSADPVPVVGCSRGWLRVVVHRAGKPDLSGWVAPEDQCANPYSTCN